MSAPTCAAPGCRRRTWSATGRCFQHQAGHDEPASGPAEDRRAGASGPQGLLDLVWEPVDWSVIQRSSVDRVLWRYRRALPEFVWDAAALEGNSFTYPEVQTLLEGITVGGRRVEEADQVTALADSSRLIDDLVREGAFRLDKTTSDAVHAVVARHEAIESGHFRGEGLVVSDVSVFLGELGRRTPPRTEPGGANLIARHEALVAAVATLEPVPAAVVYNLAACRDQLYYDGNKRTARLMMNASLLSTGHDAISVPAAMRLGYNAAMARFYASGDATEMMTMYRDLALETASRR